MGSSQPKRGRRQEHISCDPGRLLAESGKKVLMLDLDPHGSLSTWFGHDPDTIAHSAFDLFQHQGKVPADLPAQLICSTPDENVFLIPASSALATLERRMIGVEGMGLIISRTLALLWDDFDYVLIDNTPSLGVLMVNALAAAQHLLIPVQTEFLALKGLERMLHTLNMVIRSQKNKLAYTDRADTVRSPHPGIGAKSACLAAAVRCR